MEESVFEEIKVIGDECSRLESLLIPVLQEFAKAWNAVSAITSDVPECSELDGRLILLNYFLKRLPIDKLSEELALASIRDVSDKIRSRALARRGVMVS